MGPLSPVVVLKDEYTEQERAFIKYMMENVPEFVIIDERDERNRMLVPLEYEAKRLQEELCPASEAVQSQPVMPAKIEIKDVK